MQMCAFHGELCNMTLFLKEKYFFLTDILEVLSPVESKSTLALKKNPECTENSLNFCHCLSEPLKSLIFKQSEDFVFPNQVNFFSRWISLN